jgi:hypothetical protein
MIFHCFHQLNYQTINIDSCLINSLIVAAFIWNQPFFSSVKEMKKNKTIL